MRMIEYIKTLNCPKHDGLYLEPLAEMFLDMHNTHAKMVPQLYKPATIDDIKEHIKSPHNYYKTFIAMEDYEILGYIALAEIRNKETKLYPEIHYVNIGGIYVKPKHRHKGVATYMLQYAEMYAINNNIESINASVCFFNDVSSLLFSKNGFDSVNFKTIKRL